MKTDVLGKLEIAYRSISELNENTSSPRTHSEKQLTKLEKSIIEFGLIIPLVIDQNNTIISGNAVFRAAKHAGFSEVPTVMIEHLTNAQKKAFVIAVNKISEESGWDNLILKADFELLIQETFDLSITGFEIGEIDVIMLDMTDESGNPIGENDELPDESEIPERVKSGDLWGLGNHKMICGNSLKDGILKVLTDGKKAKMVFGDPPYNCKVNGHVCESGKNQDSVRAPEKLKQVELTTFLKKSITN